MPVDCGKPRLFHQSTEWTVFNPEGMEDFFHGQTKLPILPEKCPRIARRGTGWLGKLFLALKRSRMSG